MSNQVSEVLRYVIDVFDSMPLVNTIVFKDDDVVDVEKENIYPLVSINLLESPAPEQYEKQVTLGIEVYNQRDDRKVATPSKLMSDTNYIDNIGICDTIANNFLLEVLKSHNEFDINVVEDATSNFKYIRKDERNALDGVKFEVTLLTHQNDI